MDFVSNVFKKYVNFKNDGPSQEQNINKDEAKEIDMENNSIANLNNTRVFENDSEGVLNKCISLNPNDSTTFEENGFQREASIKSPELSNLKAATVFKNNMSSNQVFNDADNFLRIDDAKNNPLLTVSKNLVIEKESPNVEETATEIPNYYDETVDNEDFKSLDATDSLNLSENEDLETNPITPRISTPTDAGSSFGFLPEEQLIEQEISSEELIISKQNKENTLPTNFGTINGELQNPQNEGDNLGEKQIQNTAPEELSKSLENIQITQHSNVTEELVENQRNNFDFVTENGAIEIFAKENKIPEITTINNLSSKDEHDENILKFKADKHFNIKETLDEHLDDNTAENLKDKCIRIDKVIDTKFDILKETEVQQRSISPEKQQNVDNSQGSQQIFIEDNNITESSKNLSKEKRLDQKPNEKQIQKEYVKTQENLKKENLGRSKIENLETNRKTELRQKKTEEFLPFGSEQQIFERKKRIQDRGSYKSENYLKTVGVVKANPKSERISDDCNITISTKMDISDKLEEENSDLKLQLNASQQERAALELEVRQKEEIIIKTQAELLRKEQAYKHEIKQLKQKLEEKSAENDSSSLKELEETIKNLKTRETKLISEVNSLTKEENSYKKIMAEYETNLRDKVNEIQKLREEHETVKRHLANLELAFSDVHQKYERSKSIIERYKLNEEALLQRLSASEEMVQKSEEKYDSLKAHAKAQIEKIGKEMINIRESNDTDLHKLQTIIKRLEIKNASLMESLDQKTKECQALTALCDEVTGKV